MRLYLKYKTRWSEIARHVDGRTDNQIKNRFNSNLKKRLQDKDFKDLVAADSSCNEGSEDSVTFEGNSAEVKRTSISATKDFSNRVYSKNDEPSLQASITNTIMETSMAIRTVPLPNADATIDENETMPLIFSC